MTTRSWLFQVHDLPAIKITRIKQGNDATRIITQVCNVWRETGSI
jgi:hypothetical protein